MSACVGFLFFSCLSLSVGLLLGNGRQSETKMEYLNLNLNLCRII